MSRQRPRGPGDSGPIVELFSFPVIFGFALGSFLTITLALFVGPVLFYPSLFMLSWVLASFVRRWVQRRGLRGSAQRAEEEERERRALAARAAAAQTGAGGARRRRRRRGGGAARPPTG